MSEVTAERLVRLISSEVCDADNAEEYASALKRLAAGLGDEALIQAKVRFFRALGDTTRLRIVKMLAQKEMCVCEVMVALELSQPTASHHLNILEREGVVEKRREGKWVLYRLSTPKTVDLIDAAVAER